MDDLVTWLRQQLDDDERVARAGGGSSHFYDCDPSECVDHHERWDDERVLAEVDAKRQLIDRYETMHWHGAAIPDSAHPEMRTEETGACRTCVTLRILAMPYADRPGYDETWKP